MSFSPAVSYGNNQYNMNGPSTSMVTIIRNYSPMCACAACTSHGYYSRAAFILFRGSAGVAAIRERHLFEEIMVCTCHCSTADEAWYWLKHVLHRGDFYNTQATVLSRNCHSLIAGKFPTKCDCGLNFSRIFCFTCNVQETSFL